MNRASEAMGELHLLDSLAGQDSFLHRIHPAVKILVTVYYILMTVSFEKYNLTGLAGMVLVPILMLELGTLSVTLLFRQLRVLFGLLFLVGIANPWFDRAVIARWGSVNVTGGMISFFTMYLKGVFSLTVSYLLIASTGMERLCYGLQRLHLPRTLITVVLLIYRYLMLFLKEGNQTMLAYSLRAPGQKGIHIRAWGSMVGAMLLRCVDRSEAVYESMRLRGFRGSFRLSGGRIAGRSVSIGYFFGMLLIITMLRVLPVFELAGSFLQ